MKPLFRTLGTTIAATLLVSAGLVVLFSSVQAEEDLPAPVPPAMGMMAPPAFADFDADGNGCINAEEFAAGWNNRRAGNANMPAFADFDTDQDGFISEQELGEGRAKRIAERAAEGRQMRNVAKAASFAEIDANDDDKIDPEEFAAHQLQDRQQRP
ncbi:MAG: EF-hand domain-containing protein [Gammaproteobacteria bacterium]|nr:EF-hand domain-containing protein [Gammaproteobacteria bacterium]MBU1722422.1 EF-hand domain-containing protein [Gammaproteobacteria bacterium]MBU2004641.1 EF-hand domain-containing protein [Gammaproteobacteria bacterium]